MLKVSDLMTQSVVTLAKDTALADAATTLAMLGVSGAPVCGRGGRVIGVFSKSDVVGADGTVKVATVGELMTADVVTVQPEDALGSAIALMAEKGVHRLLVVHDGDVLAGILTPMDIVKAIAAGKLAVHAHASDE